MKKKTLLSVNVNKIATLRNARGGDLPSVIEFSRVIVEAGAAGITVHPRPDGRHIRTQDVFELRDFLAPWKAKGIEYNIEGYPSEDFLELLEKAKPHQATLVPDPPHVLTSNAGFELEANMEFLAKVIARIKKAGVRVSLFMDPHRWTPEQKRNLAKLHPDRVELYTESFAKAHATPNEGMVLQLYRNMADDIVSLGIGLNAGHDLNQKNLAALVSTIPEIHEVSIGHALISEALMDGMTTTVNRYLRILESPAIIK